MILLEKEGKQIIVDDEKKDLATKLNILWIYDIINFNDL